MVVSSLPNSNPAPSRDVGPTEAYLREPSSRPEVQSTESSRPSKADSAPASEAQRPSHWPTGLPNETPSGFVQADPNHEPPSSGQSQFPPRLSRAPRSPNSPYADVDLPGFVAQSFRHRRPTIAEPLPQTVSERAPATVTVETECVTLDMRPSRASGHAEGRAVGRAVRRSSARTPVSRLWHRLRFSRFFPLIGSNTWKPKKPRRGRPEGTKGAGSRSL